MKSARVASDGEKMLVPKDNGQGIMTWFGQEMC